MKMICEAHAGQKMHVAGHDLEIDKKGCVEVPKCESKKEETEVLKRLKLAGFQALKKGQIVDPDPDQEPELEPEPEKAPDADPENKGDGEEKPKFMRGKGNK